MPSLLQPRPVYIESEPCLEWLHAGVWRGFSVDDLRRVSALELLMRRAGRGVFAGGPRRGGGSCFRSRRVLRCEPCKRQGEGWTVCPATTPLLPARDVISCQMLDRCSVRGRRERGKKNRFRTTNLNFESNDTSCLCKFAAFDPLIVDLTAASGATDWNWKLQPANLDSCFCAQG